MKLITESDTSALTEILEVAYADLKAKRLDLEIPGLREPYIIAISGVCLEASGSATRAAHNLGIIVSRERHIGHSLTSFAPLDLASSEYDPVLCLTWGNSIKMHT